MKSKLLVAIVVLQGLILTSQWSSGGNGPTKAYGDVPEQLNSRSQIVDELKTLNGKMDRLVEILNSGNLQVKVAQPDEKAKEPARGNVR